LGLDNHLIYIARSGVTFDIDYNQYFKTSGNYANSWYDVGYYHGLNVWQQHLDGDTSCNTSNSDCNSAIGNPHFKNLPTIVKKLASLDFTSGKIIFSCLELNIIILFKIGMCDYGEYGLT